MLCTSSNAFGGKISGTWIFKSQSMIPRLIRSRGSSPKKYVYQRIPSCSNSSAMKTTATWNICRASRITSAVAFPEAEFPNSFLRGRSGCCCSDLNFLSGIHFHFFIHLGIDHNARADLQFIDGRRLLRLEVFRSLVQHHDDGFAVLVLNGNGVLAYRSHRTHQMGRVAVREKGAGQERDGQQKRDSLFQHMSP